MGSFWPHNKNQLNLASCLCVTCFTVPLGLFRSTKGSMHGQFGDQKVSNLSVWLVFFYRGKHFQHEEVKEVPKPVRMGSNVLSHIVILRWDERGDQRGELMEHLTFRIFYSERKASSGSLNWLLAQSVCLPKTVVHMRNVDCSWFSAFHANIKGPTCVCFSLPFSMLPESMHPHSSCG